MKPPRFHGVLLSCVCDVPKPDGLIVRSIGAQDILFRACMCDRNVIETTRALLAGKETDVYLHWHEWSQVTTAFVGLMRDAMHDRYLPECDQFEAAYWLCDISIAHVSAHEKIPERLCLLFKQNQTAMRICSRYSLSGEKK